VSLSVKINMADVDALFDGVATQCEEAARPAAQAGAQVLYDEVQRNVSRIKRRTGNLASSIYQAFSPERSANGLALYRIGWNARKAPHGHLVEWGHLQRYEISFDPTTRRFTTHKDRPLPVPRHVAARPFLRPAAAKLGAARDAALQRYMLELSKRGITR